MESVSSMESVGAMVFYEEDCSVKAYMGVRKSVTKSELSKEHLELESNQLEDHINDIHDSQQDPDNLEVNEVCMGKEEEEEEDGENTSKVDEEGKTVSDIWNDEGEETTERVHEQANPTFVDVKYAKQNGGNSSKINEDSITKIWSDIPSNEDGDVIAQNDGVPEQAQRTTELDVPGGVIRMSNLKGGKGVADIWNDEDGETTTKSERVHKQAQPTSDDVRLAKKYRGNSSKINEDSMTKIWSDIPSNADRNTCIIAQKDEVPEQAQRTTGPEYDNKDTVNTPEMDGVAEDSKEEGQDGENIPTEYDNKDTVNIPEMDGVTEDSKEEGQDGENIPTVNDKQAGEEEEKGEGNIPKMDEDFKTSTEYDNKDTVNTPEMDGVAEDSKMEGQDGENIPSVNDKQAGEEEEKGGGKTTKMDEVFKTSTEYDNKDTVNTPEMGGVTEDSKEEGQDGENIPTVNDNQTGDDEEKGGGNTPKMDKDFKTSTNNNAECDSEQDADNSPSWLNGRNIWQFLSFGEFFLILLIGILAPAVAYATPASNPHKYAADPGNTQGFFLCDYFSTPFFNITELFDIHCKRRCYNESKKKCPSGLEGFCVQVVTENRIIAGCINTTGLYLDGEKCLLVTVVQGYHKYKAECHDKKCPTCTSANSLEERLKMCLFQNEISGDSHSSDCAPETSSTSTGCVQPTYWILCLGIAVVLFVVLTSQ